MSALPTTTYAVMGLLAQRPMSRYDLAGMAEKTIANFWTIAKSQVYRELQRLDELEYVRGREVRQTGLPDKTLFQLTAKGQRAFRDWLNSPELEGDRYRSSLMVKVFFAREMDGDLLVKTLEAYRENCQASADQLEQVTASLKSNPDMFFVRSTARLGQMVSQTASDWARQTLESLSERSVR